MDAWWPKLLEAEFQPALGGEVFDAVQSMVGFGGPYVRRLTVGPRLRRRLVRLRQQGPARRVRANGAGTARRGVKEPTAAAGRSRLPRGAAAVAAAALSVTPQQIYGHGDCESDPQASCHDMNRWTSASGISIPPFPFQNRPTFQQTIELTQKLPR